MKSTILITAFLIVFGAKLTAAQKKIAQPKFPQHWNDESLMEVITTIHHSDELAQFEAYLTTKKAKDLDLIHVYPYHVKSKASILAWACYGKKFKIAKLLLAHGADPNYGPVSPLCLALAKIHEYGISSEEQNSSFLELIQNLVIRGVNIKDGLSFEKESALLLAVKMQNFDLVDHFLTHGADVNFHRLFEASPLINATQLNNTKIALLLLEHNADLNCNSCGLNWPALIWAIINRNSILVERYITAGAPVNRTYKEPTNYSYPETSRTSELTALHIACSLSKVLNENDEIIELQPSTKIITCLLKAGADAGAIDSTGNTPLHQAAQTRNISAIQLLLGQ